MVEEEILQRAKEFEKEKRADIKKASEKLKRFLKLYPFRDHPDKIDSLWGWSTVYYPENKQTFLYWIESELDELGRIQIENPLYVKYARDVSEKFKKLLRTIVNDALSVSQKIDAHWENIKGLSGDKTIPKKILFCYYPEKVLPIYKTDYLEYLAKNFHIDFEKEAYDLYRKAYEKLSVGQKFEILNKVLMEFKDSIPEFKEWSNLLFARFFYYDYPYGFPIPKEIKPSKPFVLESIGWYWYELWDHWILVDDAGLLNSYRKECGCGGNHLIGWMYVDRDAGVSMLVHSFCELFPDGTIRVKGGPAERREMLTVRYDSLNKFSLAPLGEKQRKEFNLPAQPPLSENYTNPQVELLRRLRLLDTLRNERYPDDIRTFLLDPEMRPEAVWVRLERQLAENEFECTLLNEPEQDFGVHLYDRVVVIVKRAEYRTMSICIGLLSNLSKNIGRIFSDFSEYSKEFF